MTQVVNPRLTPEETQKVYEHHARIFNQRHPVGSPVWYRPFYTNTLVYEATVSEPAFLSLSGEVVVGLAEVPGCVPLRLVKPVLEDRRNEVNPVPLGDQPTVMVAQCDRLICKASDAIKSWKNLLFPGFGDLEHLERAATYLREAADCAEAAFQELARGDS